MSSTFFKLSSEKEFADVEAGTLKTSSCPSVLSWLSDLGWPPVLNSVGRVSADICRRLMCEFLYSSSIWSSFTSFTSFTAARLLGVFRPGVRTCPALVV